MFRSKSKLSLWTQEDAQQMSQDFNYFIHLMLDEKLDDLFIERHENENDISLENLNTTVARIDREKRSYEKEVREIWEKSKKVKVDLDSDFFELGGHSLMTIQITSEISEQLKIKLSINDLFMNPNFADYLAVVDDVLISQVTDNTPMIPKTELLEIPLNPKQMRLWFLEQVDEQTRATISRRLGHLKMISAQKISKTLYTILLSAMR